MLTRQRPKRFVGALQDALRPDIDPAPRSHLAIHHQSFGLQLAEMIPIGPAADEIGVGDQHTRCILVRLEYPDRLSRLDE